MESQRIRTTNSKEKTHVFWVVSSLNRHPHPVVASSHLWPGDLLKPHITSCLVLALPCTFRTFHGWSPPWVLWALNGPVRLQAKFTHMSPSRRTLCFTTSWRMIVQETNLCARCCRAMAAISRPLRVRPTLTSPFSRRSRPVLPAFLSRCSVHETPNFSKIGLFYPPTLLSTDHDQWLKHRSMDDRGQMLTDLVGLVKLRLTAMLSFPEFRPTTRVSQHTQVPRTGKPVDTFTDTSCVTVEDCWSNNIAHDCCRAKHTPTCLPSAEESGPRIFFAPPSDGVTCCLARGSSSHVCRTNTTIECSPSRCITRRG